MARASFTLRKSTTEQGSYLQYPIDDPAYTTRDDNDNYLRGDQLTLAPVAPVSDLMYIDAQVIDYDTVMLEWSVSLETTLGPTPVPYQAIINYGSNGTPKSINKGETIVEATGSDTFIHEVSTQRRWAYYTLFIRYVSDAGDDYYEPAATVKVFVPKNLGGSETLFNRIPEYYRLLDDQQGAVGNGPLKKFVSVFGWELDKTRSLIEYVLSMKDPQLADQTVIDMLAKDFGIDLQSQELGTGRLRNLVDAIGYIRRGKGTLDIVERAFKAITECDVEYDLTASPVPDIRVYAQRANLITDPRVVGGIVGSIDGGVPSSVYPAGFVLDCGELSESQLDGDYDGGATPTPSYTGIGTSSTALTGGWLAYPDLIDPGTNIFERANADIRVVAGDVFYFSCHTGADIQDIISNVYLYTGSYADGLSVLIAESDAQVVVGTTKYWRLEIPEDYTSYTDAVLVIRYQDTVAYNADDFEYLLLERNSIDEYFDGNSNAGAWIVDSVGAVSDYGWAGTEDSSISVYTDNFQRLKYAFARLVPTVLPVNMLVTSGTVYSNQTPTINLNYDITWNNIPGV